MGQAGIQISQNTKIKKEKMRMMQDIREIRKLETGNWKDPLTAGLAVKKWVLWNKPTIAKSVKNIMNSFPKLKIKINKIKS